MTTDWPRGRDSAVVLFSGGMDSTWCLYHAKSIYRRTYALAVDYGQRHAEFELLSARRIAAKLGIPLAVSVVRLATVDGLCSHKPLERGNDASGTSNAFVPGRNLHLLTIAGAHALRVDASVLIIGCCADDAGGFPDCKPSFLRSAQEAVSTALSRDFVVHAPLVTRFKADMATGTTQQLRSLLEESWSCYTPAPGGIQCSECDACTLRAKALP